MAAPGKPHGPRATGVHAGAASADEAGRPTSADADADAEVEVNRSLHDVLDLMAHKTERLKVVLDYYRLVELPDKDARIRQLIAEIDRRQDKLDELKRLILETRDDPEH